MIQRRPLAQHVVSHLQTNITYSWNGRISLVNLHMTFGGPPVIYSALFSSKMFSLDDTINFFRQQENSSFAAVSSGVADIRSRTQNGQHFFVNKNSAHFLSLNAEVESPTIPTVINSFHPQKQQRIQGNNSGGLELPRSLPRNNRRLCINFWHSDISGGGVEPFQPPCICHCIQFMCFTHQNPGPLAPLTSNASPESATGSTSAYLIARTGTAEALDRSDISWINYYHL